MFLIVMDSKRQAECQIEWIYNIICIVCVVMYPRQLLFTWQFSLPTMQRKVCLVAICKITIQKNTIHGVLLYFFFSFCTYHSHENFLLFYRLTIEAVCKVGENLQAQWKVLPHTLQHILAVRLSPDNIS